MSGSIQVAGTAAFPGRVTPVGRRRTITPEILGLALLLTAGTVPAARAESALDGRADPAAAIAAWAVKQQDAAGQPLRLPQAPQRITDEASARVLPDYSFHALVFRQFPVARMPPPPLGSQNLFVVDKAGAVTHIKDVDQLKTFVREHLVAVKDAAAAKDALRAWLRLAEEMAQDGMYSFSIPEDKIVVTPPQGDLKVLSVEGVALVESRGGNRGQIRAKLSFDTAGRMQGAIDHQVAIKPGMRPICQATKLLDRDSIVRRMAEQDILLMGPAAADYLKEQRAKASPELQQAIDVIWQRIQSDE